jgi:arylsulfatase A-like enzyme
MQKLADRSMLFARAYVSVALCMPSRNALLFSRRPDTAQAWEIANTQFPRRCGGAQCAGNQCGPHCGIREPGPGGQLAVTLPGWFYRNGFFTVGAGKIFHEGTFTDNQDFEHSWTPSTTNPRTGLFEAHTNTTHQAKFNGKPAQPSWYAFDVDDEAMGETQLALHIVSTIKNLSDTAMLAAAETATDAPPPAPFFVAVGFHKPHVPWYAPAKYFDLYPNDTITLAPSRHKPINAPNIGMQAVAGIWSSPTTAAQLSCPYTDLCAEIYPGAPFAHGRPLMTREYPFDNTTFPAWKEREMRRAYWACVSYTDANIGRVLDALEVSPFASNTVVVLWGDHGYHLGDNDMFAKHSNFEHATRIPFMIHVPGLRPGHSSARFPFFSTEIYTRGCYYWFPRLLA